MKTCPTCGETKPFTEFHKDRSKRDGLNLYCKPCMIAKQRTFAKRPPRHADPEGMKTCQRCKSLKPLADFHRSTLHHDGFDRRCKTCTNELHRAWRLKNLGKVAKDAARRRHEQPDRYADYNLKKNYGLEAGEYDRLLNHQQGRCAICETTDTGRFRRFHVDHCHETGEVRGLLCHNCNVGIGHLQHSEEILFKAAAYLSPR